MATVIKKEKKKSVLSGVASAVSNVVTQKMLKEKKDGDYYLKQLSLLGGLERLNNEASIAATATANASKPAMPKQRSAEDMAEWDDSDGDWTKNIAKAQGVDLKQPAVDPTEFHPPQPAAQTYEDRRVAKLVRESKEREQARLETLLPHQKSPRTRMNVDDAGLQIAQMQEAKQRWRGRGAGRVQPHQPRTWLERTFGEEYPIKTAGTAQENVPGPYEGMTNEEADALAMKRRNIVSSGILREEARKYEQQQNVKEEAKGPATRWMTDAELDEFYANPDSTKSPLARYEKDRRIQDRADPNWPYMYAAQRSQTLDKIVAEQELERQAELLRKAGYQYKL